MTAKPTKELIARIMPFTPHRSRRLAYACAASLAVGSAGGFLAPSALSHAPLPSPFTSHSGTPSFALAPLGDAPLTASPALASAEAMAEGRALKLNNRRAQVRTGYFSDAALQAAKESVARAEAEAQASEAGAHAAEPSEGSHTPGATPARNAGELAAVLAGGITQSFTSSLGTVYVPREGQAIPAGMEIVGVRGTFVTASAGQDLDTAIAHINEIRLDAYNSGFVSQYVPIERAPALERTSQIRAVEATVYPGHLRPNGAKPSTLAAEGFATGQYETIAWGGRTLHAAIDQWAGEKEEYIKERAGESHGVTGHYTTLINPELTYVGLGMFEHSSTYGTTIVGTFSSANPAGPSGNLSGSVIQGIYVPAAAVPAGAQEFSLASSSIGTNATFATQNTVIGLRVHLQAESGN